MSSDGTKQSRQDQAARWFAAERAGMMLVEQRAEFETWRSDPRNQAALDVMRELWNDLGVLKGSPPTVAKAPKPRLAAIVIAAALLLSASGIAAIAVLSQDGRTSIATTAGEQKTQSMPDGSLVAVNVASDVSYRVTATQRLVTMGEGEAAFFVKPDRATPFVVVAGDYQVRAVGTAFNVRQRDGVVQISVSEGKVEICRVTTKDAQWVLASLSAGQRLQLPQMYSPRISPEPEPVPPDQVSEWRMRIVSYEDATVREVIDDFNRYFEKKLSVFQPTLLSRRVTVRLRVDDRERAIDTLAGLLDANMIESGGGEVLVEGAAP